MEAFQRSLACLVLAVAAGCVSGPFGVRPEIQNVGDGGEGRGEITISFEIWDDDLTWPSVAVEYRASDGVLRRATLTDASVEGVEARLDPNAGNVLLIEGWVADWTLCTVTWDSLADVLALDGQDTVTIRLTPSDFDGVGQPEEHTIGVNNHFPTLHVDKTGLTFEYLQGSGTNPPAQVVQVENTGPDLATLDWSIDPASLPGWLSASPMNGTLAWNDPAVAVSLVADPVGQGLGVNVYEADVVFAGSDPGGADAHGSPFPLHVTLTVREPEPEISIEDSAGAALTDLYFTATGGNPPDQSFFVKNSGEAGSVLAWTAADGPGSNDWLSYVPTSGSTPAGSSTEVAVSVDANGLGTGAHTAVITVSAPGATGGSKTITVHLTVGQAPALSVSPATLTFTATEGGANPASQTLSITNPGDAPLDWSVSDDANWLTLSPASGQCTSETDTVTMSVDVSGLTAATYSATITVTAPGAANSPQTVNATLILGPPTPDPTISISPASLEFIAEESGSNPSDKTLFISNSGGGMFNWEALDNAMWLELTPTYGDCTTETDAVTVSVDVAGLTAGAPYNATITIAALEATNSPVTVNVTLNVTPPAIWVDQVSGSDFTGTGTSANPYQTIGKAMSVAVSGDLVMVRPGTYYEEVSIPDLNIALVSEQGASLTTILGPGSVTTTGVRVPSTSLSAGTGVLIEGFTITGFFRGVYAWDGAAVRDCVFENNSSCALLINYAKGNSDVVGNIFRNNPTISACVKFGGYHTGGSSFFANNLIVNNGGRAVQLDSYNMTPEDVVFENNTIAFNGDGIYPSNGGGVTMRSNIIAFNGEYGIRSQSAAPWMSNNDVYGHSVNYYNMTDLTGIQGNISADPLFVGGTDYRITSFSPSKDAGFESATLQSTDIRGAARVYNATVDMGCYEWQPGDP